MVRSFQKEISMIEEEKTLFELHEERKDLPNWDTKVHCTCGFESVSRAEQWVHASDRMREALKKLYTYYMLQETL